MLPCLVDSLEATHTHRSAGANHIGLRLLSIKADHNASRPKDRTGSVLIGRTAQSVRPNLTVKLSGMEPIVPGSQHSANSGHMNGQGIAKPKRPVSKYSRHWPTPTRRSSFYKAGVHRLGLRSAPVSPQSCGCQPAPCGHRSGGRHRFGVSRPPPDWPSSSSAARSDRTGLRVQWEGHSCWPGSRRGSRPNLGGSTT